MVEKFATFPQICGELLCMTKDVPKESHHQHVASSVEYVAVVDRQRLESRTPHVGTSSIGLNWSERSQMNRATQTTPSIEVGAERDGSNGSGTFKTPGLPACALATARNGSAQNGTASFNSALRIPGSNSLAPPSPVPAAGSIRGLRPPSTTTSLRVPPTNVASNNLLNVPPRNTTRSTNPTTSSVGTDSAETTAIKGVGSGRSKIPLPPGHSPLDWARLSHDTSASAQRRLRGAELADGRYVKVSPSMLGRCKENAKSLLAMQRSRRQRLAVSAGRKAGHVDGDGDDIDGVGAGDDGGDDDGEVSIYTNDTTHITSPSGESIDLADIPLWTSLRGRVYNLTAYLPFHPGGGSILLTSAAGRDCTKLFDKYHAWVNADALLEACLVGPLVAEGADGGARAVRASPVN